MYAYLELTLHHNRHATGIILKVLHAYCRGLLKSVSPVELVSPRSFFAALLILYIWWCASLGEQVLSFKWMNTIPLEFSVNGIVTEQWPLFWSSSTVNACTCNWFGISPGGIPPIYTCQWRRDRKFTLRYFSAKDNGNYNNHPKLCTWFEYTNTLPCSQSMTQDCLQKLLQCRA